MYREGIFLLTRSASRPRFQLPAERAANQRRTSPVPSAKVVHDFQPRWMPARVGSRDDRASSPARAAAETAGTDDPAAAAMVSYRVLTDVSAPVPMFMRSPLPFAAARAKASTTSST